MFLSFPQKNAVTIESVLLKASLPTIHSWMFALLSTLILRYNQFVNQAVTTMVYVNFAL